MVLKAMIEFVSQLKTLGLYALSFNISVGLSQGIFSQTPQLKRVCALGAHALNK